MTIQSHWWQTYFSTLYGKLYRGPLAEDLLTEDEVETLEGVFNGATGPVLDLGCGFGRHLAPLRKAGVPVLGIDWSQDLLLNAGARLKRYLARGDLRALPARSNSAAGAFMMFNTFGYFAERDNETVLGEVARVLRPGAPLVMDLPNRAGMREAVAQMPAAMRVEDDAEIIESWWIDEENKRVESQGSWRVAKAEQTWSLSIRLYTPVELTRMLRKAGFAGDVEIRFLEDLVDLGTDEPVPAPSGSHWRQSSGMAVLARR